MPLLDGVALAVVLGLEARRGLLSAGPYHKLSHSGPYLEGASDAPRTGLKAKENPYSKFCD